MKYIKSYENFKSPEDWQIGDIVVAKETIYASNGQWLREGHKYKILEIGDSGDLEEGIIKVQEFDISGHHILDRFFYKWRFITLEEWELKQSTEKYNL